MKFNQRMTAGPRGGRAVQATPCSGCVSWRSCRPGAITEPWGCESWVDQDGRRALPDQIEPEGGAAEYERDRIAAEADLARLRASLPTDPRGFYDGAYFKDPEGDPQPHADPSVRWDLEPFETPEPEPEPFRPAAPYSPDQSRGEATAQACLEMPDAGPLFAGCLEARR